MSLIAKYYQFLFAYVERKKLSFLTYQKLAHSSTWNNSNIVIKPISSLTASKWAHRLTGPWTEAKHAKWIGDEPIQ